MKDKRQLKKLEDEHTLVRPKVVFIFKLCFILFSFQRISSDYRLFETSEKMLKAFQRGAQIAAKVWL